MTKRPIISHIDTHSDALIEFTCQWLVSHENNNANIKAGFRYLRSLYLLHSPLSTRVSAYKHG